MNKKVITFGKIVEDKQCSLDNKLVYNNSISTNIGMQKSILSNLSNDMFNDKEKSDIHYCMKRDIQNKVNGYKAQDVKKNIYDCDNFITVDETYDKLITSGLVCEYCRNNVCIIYHKKKQGNQWTLDRIDNYIGHNNDNCIISCLKCNLQRRRLDDKKFKFTKQMKLCKIS